MILLAEFLITLKLRCQCDGILRRTKERQAVTKEELTDWALKSGWQMIGGFPSLTRPSRPNEAIVRLVLKGTVVQLEVKKPAGKWDKISSAAYSKLTPDEETGMPIGLGLDQHRGENARDARRGKQDPAEQF